jgi:hypothetical protein
MAGTRKIISCSVFGARAVYINRLWNPETTDQNGKPLDKPRYSVTGIIPKTKANWFEEKSLESIAAASVDMFNTLFAPRGFNPAILIWPVKDGDQPNRQGKLSDWARGHWLIRADTTNRDYVSVEMANNGKVEPIPAPRMGGRVIVKDGDSCILTVGLAESQGPNPGIKTYLNGVLFTAPGEAIVLGSRVDNEELLRQAQQQGLNVTGMGGFAPSNAFPAPQAPQAPAFPAPQAGAFPAPQAGGFPAPQAGAFPAPQAGAFPAPQAGAFPAPQAPAFPAPQAGGFPAPQAPAFPAPQAGAFPAPQAGQPFDPNKIPY